MSDIQTIRDFVEMAARQFEQGAPQGMLGRHGLLARFGREFAAGPDTLAGKRMTAKQCFRNCTVRALSDPSLIYVEGLFSIYGLPIEHAWLVRRGTTEVIDPTLKPAKHPEAHGGYFGIPFKTDYLRRQTIRAGVYGLITHTNRDLFTTHHQTPALFLDGLE